MVSRNIQKIYFPLFLIFLVVSAFCILFKDFLNEKKIDSLVLSGANTLLFILGMISMLMYQKALQNSNPSVFMRSVMGATMMKLLIIAVTVFAYLYFAGKNRSLYAVVAGMGLYIIYTIIEVRNAFRMNKESNGNK